MTDLPPVFVPQLGPAAKVGHVEGPEPGGVDDGEAERGVERTAEAEVEDLRGAMERVPGVGG